MEHSAASSRAAATRSNSLSPRPVSPPREKRKFTTEAGEEWEFTRPVKKPRVSTAPFALDEFRAGRNTSNGNNNISSGTPPPKQRLSSPSTARGKRSRDPSDQDSDTQPPSPKRRMTSVTDLGDDAARPRTRGWLKSLHQREEVAASEDRSGALQGVSGFDAGSGATQSSGSVEREAELELGDYEDDEDAPAVDLGLRSNDNLEQVAPLQEPAMTFPPAANIQEGQESAMPVDSIESDQDFVTVVSDPNRSAANTTRPVVWQNQGFRLEASISRSPSPATKYLRARAKSSGSNSSTSSRPRPRFGGFSRTATMIQHHLDAQSQGQQQQRSRRAVEASLDHLISGMASEPANTSSSAITPGPVTAVESATFPASVMAAASQRSYSPVRESDAYSERSFLSYQETDSDPSPGSELDPNHSPVGVASPEYSPSRNLDPNLSPVRELDPDLDPDLSPVQKWVRYERSPYLNLDPTLANATFDSSPAPEYSEHSVVYEYVGPGLPPNMNRYQYLDPNLSPVRSIRYEDEEFLEDPYTYPSNSNSTLSPTYQFSPIMSTAVSPVEPSIVTDSDDNEPIIVDTDTDKFASQQPDSVHISGLGITQQAGNISNSPITYNDDELASLQLWSELESYLADERNVYQSAEMVRAPSSLATAPQQDGRERHLACAPGASLLHVPLPDINPSLSSAEEAQRIMAAHLDEGPNEEDYEILRLVMAELEDQMDVDDNDDNPDLFISKQKEVRERFRRQRDRESEQIKQLDLAHRRIQADRMRLDEAPDTEPETQIVYDQDVDDNVCDFHFNDIYGGREAVQERLQAALDHWKSKLPHPSTFPAEHWIEEARTLQVNEANASNADEKIYWSNRKLKAIYCSRGELRDARLCDTHIRLALLAWQKAVSASQEETAEFTKRVSEIEIEDPETTVRAKLAPFLTQLPPELDQKVTQILSIPNPHKEVAKSVDGVALTRKDFATVLHSANYHTGEPEGWLNDEIINGFFSALCNALNEKSGHTKGKIPPFASYATSWYETVSKNAKGVYAIERWSRRKGIKGDKLLKCKRIFFPINPGNHWSLLVICPDTRTIEYLDSLDIGLPNLSRKSDRYVKQAREWLAMELGDQYVEAEWSVVDRRSAIQNNGSDCGVFTCLNGFVSALELSNPKNEFGPEHIPHARRALVSMFDVGGFIKHFEL